MSPNYPLSFFGLPSDFPLDLLATLQSGGTLTVLNHPLGNDDKFHGISPNSNVSDLCLHDEWFATPFSRIAMIFVLNILNGLVISILIHISSKITIGGIITN